MLHLSYFKRFFFGFCFVRLFVCVFFLVSRVTVELFFYIRTNSQKLGVIEVHLVKREEKLSACTFQF